MNNNTNYESLFANFDKAGAFDKIASMFYDVNFGTTSKSEFELLMFSFYMDALISDNQKEEGTIDYNQCSDYEIGKQLGLTQSKIRNLKLKKQARYRVNFDWRKSLASISDNIRLEGNKIIIPVIDPNLNEEIRHFINSNGGYIEFESGRDFIRIRIEYYLMIIFESFDINDKRKFIKESKNILNKKNKDEEAFLKIDKKEIYKDVVDITKNGLELVDNLVQLVNPSNTLIKILHSLICNG